MKISQPFVLLLGGLLSASSIGCSVINAVVNDYRPASREGRGSTERLVAIGRVFENQGQYDRAEFMYRKALKENPKDPVIREQLQQLAERRNSGQSGADSLSSALAMADQVSSRSTATYRSELSGYGSSTPANAVMGQSGAMELTSASGIEESADTSIADPGAVIVAVASSPPTNTVVYQASAAAKGTRVTADEILAVVDSPADNADLLLNGLRNADLLETQCLAATLLGDCDPADSRIRDALEQASQTAKDPRLLLAISDSRIQRHEGDAETARCLIELGQMESSEIQIQALSELRYFAGTESNADCISSLRSLLDHESPGIRTVAVLTLGDFPELDEATAALLSKMATEDQSPEVRDAAKAAIGRSRPAEMNEAHVMIVQPR